MTETEERLFRMMEQQQALTAALIARLGGVLKSDVPGMMIEAAPEVHRIEAQASVPADDGLPRMKIEDIVPLFTQYHKGQVKESTRTAFLNNTLRSKWTIEHFGSMYLDEMDWLTIQDWLDTLETHTRHLCDYIRDLKRLITWARERKKCKTPPEFPHPFTFKRIEKKHGVELDDETFVTLRKYCLSHYMDDTGAAGALIAIHTGLRIGEVCGLKVGDIDFDKGTLTVARTVERCYNSLERKSQVYINTPKTRHSARTIPMDDDICKAFSNLCKGRNADAFILRVKTAKSDDGICEPRQLRTYYEGMLKRAHIAHYNFHSLRHTFVSRHIRAGINAKAVSAYVGHADLKMTLGVYTHLNEDDMRQVVVNKTEARNGKT